ncbi:hypothetical protein BD414DRAFT_235382 [Trametes punicea]|nr:hypothetical protein BD414DRAFT_235382 [Trametes punicea]
MSSTTSYSSLPLQVSASAQTLLPDGQDGQSLQPGTGPALTSSASLYLYTFLATIVLLLLVAVSIIARSYVVRRRQSALLAEAIANGTYIPPTKLRIGHKPKMYQVALTMEPQEDIGTGGEKGEGACHSVEKEKRRLSTYDGLAVKWHRMMPVSCRLLNPPKPPPPPDISSPSPPTTATQISPTRSRGRWSWPFIARRDSQPLLPTTVTSPPSPRASLPASQTPPEQPSRPVSMATTLVGEPRPSTSMTTRALSPVPSAKYAPRSPTPAATLVAPTPAPPEEHVRVAVLITMPFALATAAERASEHGNEAPAVLPCMEFGVCEVLLEEPFDRPKIVPSPTPLPPLGEVPSEDASYTSALNVS